MLTSPRSAAGSPSQGAPSPHACDGPEATPAESCAPREQPREELASAQAQWPGRHCAFRGELQVLGRPSRLGGEPAAAQSEGCLLAGAQTSPGSPYAQHAVPVAWGAAEQHG